MLISNMPIHQQPFGSTPNNVPVSLFTLTNKNGVTVKITNLGGIVTSILVPDKNEVLGEINLGFPQLDNYLKGHPAFGALVGRYANRIANGQFALAGKTYQLPINNGPNHLHGGLKGFDQAIWKAVAVEKRGIPSLILTYLSKDGEEGYPGNLSCTVTYTLTDENELKINYQANTDQPTVLNLTNHCYFNLKDGGKTSVLDHDIQIFAEHFTPVNQHVIPTGEIKSVKRTPFNFLKKRKIGERIEQANAQLKIGQGYDHNYVLPQKEGLKKAARVIESTSGRVLEVFTTEPGLQFYTANWLDGSLTGHHNIAYQRRCAFCLETQHFPNSPNQPSFPSTVLQPDEVFESTTIYRFSVLK
ncbi:MAG: aldose epimerase family protein [Bacteroidota bacterium]